MLHREKMKPKYALEDYIYEMESRSLEPSAEAEDLDVYTQLQKKEKDLILAAELGKALLEKNEELSRQNEKLAEDYSQKLEELEQERHALRRRVSALQSESEARLLELQGDAAAAAQALQQREAALRAAEKDKQALVQQLAEQNARLAKQLKESHRTEEQLSAQMQKLRDQCDLRKSSLQDHLSSLEAMREEVQLLCEQKAELERRAQALLRTRDEQAAALDDASDRVTQLEQQARERLAQFRQQQRELEQLRVANRLLEEQLQQLQPPGDGPHGQGRSLLTEMECDDVAPDLAPALALDHEDLRQEVESACRQLRAICAELRSSQQSNDASMVSTTGMESASNSSTSNDSACELVKAGQLSAAVSELRSLLRAGAGGGGGRSRCSSSASSGIGIGLELELEAEVHRTRDALERSQAALEQRQHELKAAKLRIHALESEVSVSEAQRRALQEERDRARADALASPSAGDALLREARAARDAAAARKSHVEVELARARIDLMQANGQLLEAIQQKVELSQQLEQWQMDMQSLLDDNMRQKLTTQEQRIRLASENGVTASAKGTNKSKRLFGFFQR